MKNFTSYSQNFLKKPLISFVVPVFCFVFSVQLIQAQTPPEVSWAMQFQEETVLWKDIL